MKNDHSSIEVMVCIAVSENGDVDSYIKGDNNLQRKAKLDNWLLSKRVDTKLWSIKTIKTKVHLPMSYEDIKE